MRGHLSREQFERIGAGQLTAPDGVTYTRGTTKTARRVCDQKIGDGSPLVVYYWAAGQADYFDGAGHPWTPVDGPEAVTCIDGRRWTSIRRGRTGRGSSP